MLKLVAQCVVHRGRAAKHVPLDIAAGGQRREKRPVDRLDRAWQVVFEDAMKLKLLPGGDSQRAVAQRAG